MLLHLNDFGIDLVQDFKQSKLFDLFNWSVELFEILLRLIPSLAVRYTALLGELEPSAVKGVVQWTQSGAFGCVLYLDLLEEPLASLSLKI